MKGHWTSPLSGFKTWNTFLGTLKCIHASTNINSKKVGWKFASFPFPPSSAFWGRNDIGQNSSHNTLEPKVGWNKGPQKKVSADHECMKGNDVRNVYGNPGDCRPFSSTVWIRFTVWKWMAITRDPMCTVLLTSIFFIHSWSALIFFWGLLFHPNFGSRVVCSELKSSPAAVSAALPCHLSFFSGPWGRDREVTSKKELS